MELAESTIGLDAYPVRSKHHVGIHDRITVLPDLADDLGGQGQTLQTDLQIPGLLLERLELGLGFGSGLACLLGLLLQDRAGLLELTDFVSEVSDLLPCNRELVQGAGSTPDHPQEGSHTDQHHYQQSDDQLFHTSFPNLSCHFLLLLNSVQRKKQ